MKCERCGAYVEILYEIEDGNENTGEWDVKYVCDNCYVDITDQVPDEEDIVTCDKMKEYARGEK